MTVAHQPWLVALSLLMAFQGSYVGLHLARQIGEATGLRHRRLIASSALSLALAIWTMHFVGMLAVDLPVAADFLVLPTLLSFLICVLVVGVAVFIVSPEWVSGRRLVAAALFMGGGIVVMHHLGMLALQKGFHLGHDPFATGASAVIGVAASGMALWLGFGDRAPRSLPGSAALLALGISAMHYTAMSGTVLHPHAVEAIGTQPALSPGLLAVVVSMVAFLVSGLFLLTLVPIRPAHEITAVPTSVAPNTVSPNSATRVPGPSFSTPADTRAAAGAITPMADPAAPSTPTPLPAAPAYPKVLPVEREGLKRSLEVVRIVAVQAQAHYTQLFDGEETWFCPLTISEVETRLDPAEFSRIHRSHIVRLDKIVSLKRSGDAGEVLLSTRVPYKVPVARSRNRWLKAQLQGRLIATS